MRAKLPHTEGTVDRDGIDIHYEIYGEGEHTILFIPTWSIVHSRVYKAQIPYFSDHFRVITYDPRGNGRSGRPETADGYSLTMTVGDALAVLDATGTDRAIVFGLSYSGLVACALASYHPKRVEALISICGLTPLVPPYEARGRLVLRRPEAGLGKLRVAGWDGTSELVILNPGGAFEGRRWPVESYVRFAELWNAGRHQPAQFLTLGLPSIAAEARRMKERLGDRLVDLVGRTTPDEAFALLHRTVLVLSEDSGLMHMAWVAGVPTLALFGASRGVWARPHGNYSAYQGVCERPGGACMDGRCRSGPPTCLARLAPEAVVDRAQALVEATAGVPKRIYADGRVYAPKLGVGDS